MPVSDLRALWALHVIDSALFDIRAQAAALDPGKKLMAEIKSLTVKHAELEAESHRLNGELSDLELAQKSIDEKLKKVDKDIYGGSVVNPREVENLEKEIAALKDRRASNDEKILALWDTAPKAKEEADRYAKAIAGKNAELVAHQKTILKTKSELEASFKENSAKRPEAASRVNPALLAKYDGIRQKYGTGMAKITKESSCGACGLSLAEKTIEYVKADRYVPCEQCHRILYFSDGLF